MMLHKLLKALSTDPDLFLYENYIEPVLAQIRRLDCPLRYRYLLVLAHYYKATQAYDVASLVYLEAVQCLKDPCILSSENIFSCTFGPQAMDPSVLSFRLILLSVFCNICCCDCWLRKQVRAILEPLCNLNNLSPFMITEFLRTSIDRDETQRLRFAIAGAFIKSLAKYYQSVSIALVQNSIGLCIHELREVLYCGNIKFEIDKELEFLIFV